MRTLTIWKGREWEGKRSGRRTRRNDEGREREERWEKRCKMMHVTIYFLSNLQLHADMLNS